MVWFQRFLWLPRDPSTHTVNPLLSPPPELIYFKPMLGGGLKEMGSLFERGVYLEKTMVSVLHKEIQSEKAQE